LATNSFLLVLGGAAKTVFDVVVQHQIQLLRSETMVPHPHPVDFVEAGLGLRRIKLPAV
jgi:hypothetical protein